ncbi:diamine acetyltransferase 2-like isoform X2 [Diaphorina citri]|uniref:Diamine acetyltransferase 2-like isoform X2 n=1 Tax=Diaphorina citri TaxID=121845 RepID=A0A3Q0J6L5_DIACI|nr:diamine acetyltransferase 2-like isoform X2 [Diaphorina citri]
MLDCFFSCSFCFTCAMLISLQELAVFEKMPNAVKITQETLEKDGFESQPPLWKAFVAEVKEKDTHKNDGKLRLVGYALYFEFYSLLRGRALWLRDLYVEESWRQQKVGQTLIKSVVKMVTAKWWG